jgi:hypothetical protein
LCGAEWIMSVSGKSCLLLARQILMRTSGMNSSTYFFRNYMRPVIDPLNTQGIDKASSCAGDNHHTIATLRVRSRVRRSRRASRRSAAFICPGISQPVSLRAENDIPWADKSPPHVARRTTGEFRHRAGSPMGAAATSRAVYGPDQAPGREFHFRSRSRIEAQGSTSPSSERCSPLRCGGRRRPWVSLTSNT